METFGKISLHLFLSSKLERDENECVRMNRIHVGFRMKVFSMLFESIHSNNRAKTVLHTSIH